MDRGEPLHLAVEVRELGLDGVELVAPVQLAAKRVTYVVNTPRGSMRDLERAAARSAERAAGVNIAAGRRRQIGQTRARVHERRELGIIEQVGRDAGAARTTIVRTHGPRLSGRTRATRRHVVQLRRDRELVREDAPGERALFLLDILRELVAHSLAKCVDLVRTRRRLAEPDQESLDGDEHSCTLAPAGRATIPSDCAANSSKSLRTISCQVFQPP